MKVGDLFDPRATTAREGKRKLKADEDDGLGKVRMPSARSTDGEAYMAERPKKSKTSIKSGEDEAYMAEKGKKSKLAYMGERGGFKSSDEAYMGEEGEAYMGEEGEAYMGEGVDPAVSARSRNDYGDTFPPGSSDPRSGQGQPKNLHSEAGSNPMKKYDSERGGSFLKRYSGK